MANIDLKSGAFCMFVVYTLTAAPNAGQPKHAGQARQTIEVLEQENKCLKFMTSI